MKDQRESTIIIAHHIPWQVYICLVLNDKRKCTSNCKKMHHSQKRTPFSWGKLWQHEKELQKSDSFLQKKVIFCKHYLFFVIYIEVGHGSQRVIKLCQIKS